jgi:hypothetical protein
MQRRRVTSTPEGHGRHDVDMRGNERLTSSTGLVLLVLLVVETVTTIALRSLLPEHVFLGMLLLPPVALKLGTTGWRFMRYYTRNATYVAAGPPRLLLRVLAPFLVASTLMLFGTGVAMIIVGHRGGELRTLHTFSFVAWGVLIAIHVLAYLTRVFHDGVADWRSSASDVVAGVGTRRAVLAGSILAGVVLALATYGPQNTVLHHGGHRHHHESALAGFTRLREFPAVMTMGNVHPCRGSSSERC